MDYASVVGIGALLALVVLGGGGGGGAGAIWNLPGLLLVVGGACAATLTSVSLSQLRTIRGAVRTAFRGDEVSHEFTIGTLVRLADVARRNGILALDAEVRDDGDAFLARAVRLVVDGYDPSAIESRLTDEMEATDARHASSRQVLESLGRLCPAFGMVGTLIGLIIMLRNMGDPSRIGPGMAVALLTTLYGLVLAYGVFVPLGQKLANRNDRELLNKTIVLKGVLAIQAGDNPRVVEEKLRAFLPAGAVRSVRLREVGTAAVESVTPEQAVLSEAA